MSIHASRLTASPSVEPRGYARLQGRRSPLVRALWGAVAVLSVAITFSSLQLYLDQLRTSCNWATCQYQQLTRAQVETLRGIGLSLNDYAAFTAALTLSPMAVCLAVSALIIWRKSDDWMAALVALMLVTLWPVIVVGSLPVGPTPWQEPYLYLSFLFVALFAVVFSLFPTGRFAPPWMRWVLIVILIGLVPATFLPFTPFLSNGPVSQSGWLVSLADMVALVIAQFYRYRRVSNLIQRQQTKWVVFSLAAPITAYVAVSALILALPALAEGNPLVILAYNEAGILLPLLLPIGFGFAMLRYRLWEIDALINRALVYGALTLILTAVYAGLVIGLQASLRSVIGHDSNIALVISTLVIAALFLPLRRGVQGLIDRRFYRRKYDAAKTLETFSATLRDEVQVEALRARLLDVVDETMRPAHASLWLRPPPRESRPGA
ncbi:MAG TPA: hypothetical protein VFQ25_04330 [Ktedonobacterales bacterium]|nr:hypothetical protein [Ktedonobacterales bacterium]